MQIQGLYIYPININQTISAGIINCQNAKINDFAGIMKIENQNNYGGKVINAEHYYETFGMPNLEFEELKNSITNLSKERELNKTTF